MTPTCFERAGLLSLSEEEGTAAQEPEAADSASPKRLVILIDQINTSPPEYSFISRKISDFLDQVKGKADVMLAVIPPFEQLVPFTHDIDEVRRKLETVEVRRDRDIELAQRRRDIRDLLETNRPEGVTAAYEKALEYQALEEQETMIVFDAFKAFGKYLNNLQQQDHTIVIFISGGINSKPGQHYLDMIEKNTNVDEGLRTLSRNMPRLEPIQREIIGKLNRDNTTIYTISTRGQVDVMDNITERDKRYMALDENYNAELQEVQERMADETGGIAFRNSLNFKHGFDAILTDLDQQYLLCYVAPKHSKEGEYHKIKVSVKGPEVKIRHRKGYVD